jgi:spore coat polysaccharide biosynthesis protein SpsF
VSETDPIVPEATRLEQLWAGSFGDQYAVRNEDAGAGRDAFWDQLLSDHPVRNVLEVGCGLGANLRWIVPHLAAGEVYGVDVSHPALRRIRERLPTVNAVSAAARSLPFRDSLFELVFTAGVLIHQPDSTLPLVMSEIVRVSRRLVLGVEYQSSEQVEIAYHGESGALFKRDYGRLYRDLFPELRPVDEGFLARSDGWDDVTWWLFEKA